MTGFGVFHAENQQFEKALCAFQAAAAAGHAPSYFNVFLYLSESRPGVAIDLQGAFTAAQSGAAAGHMDSVAALAFCFFQGIGTEKNFAKAQAHMLSKYGGFFSNGMLCSRHDAS
jgi:TPR repeat protein